MLGEKLLHNVMVPVVSGLALAIIHNVALSPGEADNVAEQGVGALVLLPISPNCQPVPVVFPVSEFCSVLTPHISKHVLWHLQLTYAANTDILQA